MILWTSATVPVQTRSGVEYVEIPLDSPAADELGRAGAPGQVDNHWWARFGAALLFTVIEAVPQVAASALQNGNNNNYTSLYSPSQQVAGTILQDTMNIPPTLEKNQGESLAVFVARNLDFSSVYDLVAAQ
jgi:type IV secretion system protein VirB10